jgi:hypothetical protein|tara:strand:+ start:993 stop:1259 length:267 start_codon:yes stop_codon:yes gene_type:complete
MTGFNGHFGDVGRTAAKILPQIRAIAALALAARAKGGIVRKADFGAKRSECQHSARIALPIFHASTPRLTTANAHSSHMFSLFVALSN